MLPDEFQLNIAQQHADIPPLLARTPTATLFQPACTAIVMIQGIICWYLQTVVSYHAVYACLHYFCNFWYRKVSPPWHLRDRSVSQDQHVSKCVEIGYQQTDQQTDSCSRAMESLGTTYGILWGWTSVPHNATFRKALPKAKQNNRRAILWDYLPVIQHVKMAHLQMLYHDLPN